MDIENNIKINVDASAAVGETQKLKTGINDVGASSGALTGKLDAMTGGAVSGFRNMVGGIKGVALGFKSVGVAIALSGLGLLVITISAIIAAFKSSEAGQNKFAKLMGVIGSVTGNLIDILSDFGELAIGVFENPVQSIKNLGNLIKDNIINRFNGMLELIPAVGKAIGLFFTGKFEEAGIVAVNAMSKVALGVTDVSGKLGKLVKGTKEYAEQLKKDAQLAGVIADKRAKADTVETALIIERANAEQKKADLRNKAEEKNKYSQAERLKFLKEASAIEDDLTAKEIEVAVLRRDALVSENTLSKSNKEALTAEAEAIAKVTELDTKRLQEKKLLTSKISGLESQGAAASKKITDDKIKADEAEKKISDEKAAKQKVLDDEAAVSKAEGLQKIRDVEDFYFLKGLEREIAEIERKAEADIIELEALGAKKELIEAIEQESSDRINAIVKAASDESLKTEKENAEKEVAFQKSKDDAIAASKANLNNIISGLEQSGLAKTKAGQAVSKAIALTQIGIDSAVAISKASTLANAEGVAAQLAFPMVPGIGTVARIISYAATGLSVVSNIARAKKLLSGGGVSAPSGGDSAPSGGGGGGGGFTPNFNVVGASSQNQLAETVAGSTSEPTRAYVVYDDVKKAGDIESNAIAAAGI